MGKFGPAALVRIFVCPLFRHPVEGEDHHYYNTIIAIMMIVIAVVMMLKML